MSRNFEILERLNEEKELFRVPSIVRPKTTNGTSAASNKILSLESDPLAREEILRLVQYLFLSAMQGNCQSHAKQVVFCGIDQAEGREFLCGQVARSLAKQVQASVYLVDANVRCPRSGWLGGSQESADALKWTYQNTQNIWRQITDNLWFASLDSFGTNGVSAIDQLRVLVKDLRSESKYVIISAPPVGLYSDAALLGQVADGVVLVLEANSTRRAAARQAKQALETRNVRVLGTVLNNRTFPIPDKVYRLL
jgi:hypothetical protein